MAGKIFVNYRRDDDPSAAARVRDGLAAKFGQSNIFMDVENLLAGQRFDEELAKALSACDVLIAVMGVRWMDILRARANSGERDYVREEIAVALKRKIVVIPIRVGREGQLARLPGPEQLPDDIRDLVLYQKHDVSHERYGRDIAELNEAIVTVRKLRQPTSSNLQGRLIGTWIGLGLAIYAGTHLAGAPVWWPGTVQSGAEVTQPDLKSDQAEAAKREKAAKDAAAEAQRKPDEVEGADNVTFPAAVSPKYANETPAMARLHTCIDQYKLNKVTNGNGSLLWIQKGGGYYNRCNEKLKKSN